MRALCIAAVAAAALLAAADEGGRDDGGDSQAAIQAKRKAAWEESRRRGRDKWTSKLMSRVKRLGKEDENWLRAEIESIFKDEDNYFASVDKLRQDKKEGTISGKDYREMVRSNKEKLKEIFARRQEIVKKKIPEREQKHGIVFPPAERSDGAVDGDRTDHGDSMTAERRAELLEMTKAKGNEWIQKWMKKAARVEMPRGRVATLREQMTAVLEEQLAVMKENLEEYARFSQLQGTEEERKAAEQKYEKTMEESREKLQGFADRRRKMEQEIRDFGGPAEADLEKEEEDAERLHREHERRLEESKRRLEQWRASILEAADEKGLDRAKIDEIERDIESIIKDELVLMGRDDLWKSWSRRPRRRRGYTLRSMAPSEVESQNTIRKELQALHERRRKVAAMLGGNEL
eukprot:TRINITY_DN14181_c0_g1_i1.p1 TRINITY_DN14181_c0_g1~~TRINITY_DN14181_c0_g1_i1.p1  ORF type:complete len:405 (+),score=164.96 TRINITY_DN14181_c0_g1_i1:98-1312(+)